MLMKTANLIAGGFNGFGNAVGNYSKFCLASTLFGAGTGAAYGTARKIAFKEEDKVLSYTASGAFKGITLATKPFFLTIGAGVLIYEAVEQKVKGTPPAR